MKSGPQERVRGGPHAQALRLGQLQKFLPLRARQGQRLLGVDVLAGPQGVPADRKVRGGDGQVDDDLDLRVAQQLFHRHRPDAVFLGPGLRPRASKSAQAAMSRMSKVFPALK